MDNKMQLDSPLQPVRMQPSDLEDVLAIEKASFASPWSRDMFLEELDNRNARLLVFRLEDKLVGYICFWVVLDEVHIMNIAVHPEQRGRGYGRAILAYLESWCLQKGVKRLILEVGRRNLPARRLYRRIGFHSIGFRKQYYAVAKDDALVMEKWLGAGEEANIDRERSETK